MFRYLFASSETKLSNSCFISLFISHFVIGYFSTSLFRGYVLTDIIDSIPDFNAATEEAYIVPGNVQFPD